MARATLAFTFLHLIANRTNRTFEIAADVGISEYYSQTIGGHDTCPDSAQDGAKWEGDPGGSIIEPTEQSFAVELKNSFQVNSQEKENGSEKRR